MTGRTPTRPRHPSSLVMQLASSRPLRGLTPTSACRQVKGAARRTADVITSLLHTTAIEGHR